MNIRNVTEFAIFISDHQLVNNDSTLNQIIECVTTLRAACNCWKKEDKMKLIENCNRVYYHSVKHVVPRLKPQFLAATQERQIAFYNDSGQLIGLISR